MSHFPHPALVIVSSVRTQWLVRSLPTLLLTLILATALSDRHSATAVSVSRRDGVTPLSHLLSINPSTLTISPGSSGTATANWSSFDVACLVATNPPAGVSFTFVPQCGLNFNSTMSVFVGGGVPPAIYEITILAVDPFEETALDATIFTLIVPGQPTDTPTPTRIPTRTPTPSPPATRTPTRTRTPTPTMTRTPTPTPTGVPVVIQLAKTREYASPLCPGRDIHYIVTLSNASPGPAPLDSSILDPIPANTTYVMDSVAGGTYNAVLNRIEWFGLLAGGQSHTVSFSVLVNPGVPDGTNITNAATGTVDEVSDQESVTDQVRCPTVTPTATLTATPTVTATPTSTSSPTPTPTPSLPDLTVTGIEVNQAIQNLAHQAPLIRGKRTVVRVYVRSDRALVPRVTVKLSAYRGGASLPGSPLRSRNWVIAQPTNITTAIRGNLMNSLNFFNLPPSWLSGQVTFVAEVNPDRTIAERDYDNNTLSTAVTFHDTPAFQMWLVRIRYTRGGKNLTPTWAEFWRELRWVLDVFPTNRIWVWNGGILEFNGDLTTEEGMRELLNDLWWKDFRTGEWSFGFDEDAVWFGFVHSGVNMPRTGWAYDLGVEEAIGEADPVWGGFNMAHEIGHTMNRRHVDCPTGEPAGPDNNYPYNTRWIADGSAQGYYGFNTRIGSIVLPTQAADFMSYCWGPPPPWVSDYTYRALWNWIRDKFTSTGASSSVRLTFDRQEFLAATGIIDTATQAVTLGHFYRITEPTILSQPGEGPYSLELRDATGEVLASYAFDVSRVLESLSDTLGNFALVVPFDSNTAEIVIRHGAEQLASRPVTAHAPEVTVTHPNGGETLTGMATLTWTASDADGDDLRYTVQYSADGGATWTAVAVDLDTTSYVLDTSDVPGSTQALIRVLASDGVNTGTDQSDAVFTVSRKGPEAFIIWPEDGAAFAPGALVWLQGYGLDAEDGPLADTALSWSSSRDGFLGTGQELGLDNLSAGQHVITLSTTDSDGNVGTASIALFIGHRVYLPLALRLD